VANGDPHHWWHTALSWSGEIALASATLLLGATSWVWNKYRDDRGMLLAHEKKLASKRIEKVEAKLEQCCDMAEDDHESIKGMRLRCAEHDTLLRKIENRSGVMVNDLEWIKNRLENLT